LFCLERKLLSDLFVEVARDIVTLRYAEATALTQGARVERFDVALAAARRKKDTIKLAYLLHVQGHGCGEQALLQSLQLRTNPPMSRGDQIPEPSMKPL
jgi:hypothetical protein